jgi:hypothetical protein
MKWAFIFAAVTLQAAPPPNIDKLAAEAMTELWQKYGRQNMSEKMTLHVFCHTSFCHMKWAFIFAAVTLEAVPLPNIDKLAAEAMTELWQKYG